MEKIRNEEEKKWRNGMSRAAPLVPAPNSCFWDRFSMSLITLTVINCLPHLTELLRGRKHVLYQSLQKGSKIRNEWVKNKNEDKEKSGIN